MTRLMLTPKEVAAIVGVAEKDVRNEVVKGIVPAHRELRGKRVRIGFDVRATFCFYVTHHSPLPLPPGDRGALYRLICLRTEAEGPWSRVHDGLSHGGKLTLWLNHFLPGFREELMVYRRGLRRVETRAKVLGGETVFKGTRIPVRHVGLMATGGVLTEEILADYPALSAADVSFARIFAAMKPGPGRPAGKRLGFLRSPPEPPSGAAPESPRARRVQTTGRS